MKVRLNKRHVYGHFPPVDKAASESATSVLFLVEIFLEVRAVGRKRRCS